MDKNLQFIEIYFEIIHRTTGEKIIMDILKICEEYSTLSFSSNEEKYKGIGRLPSYPGDNTAKDYDIYVIINGERFIYNGKFISTSKSWLIKHEYNDGYFYGKRKYITKTKK